MVTAGGRSSPYPADLLELVEEYLLALDFGADRRAARLVEAMRYSLLAGGKRIRPVLTLATARSRGAEPAAVLPAAAALELIHTYSLIHDDLPAIDDDTLRRGRPTCHVAFGEDIAILAGDGLFAEAFHLLLVASRERRRRVLAAVAEIAAATGVQGMVGGQYMDVAGEAAGDDDLRTLHALKTGRLIEAAVVCGAVLSGADGRGPVPRLRRRARPALPDRRRHPRRDRRRGRARQERRQGPRPAEGHLRLALRPGRAPAPRGGGHERARERLAALPGDTADLAALTAYIRRRRR